MIGVSVINRIQNREELADYCLRRLGSPVINVEIDNTQIQDCIDDAIQTFCERHYDGYEERWVYYEITQDDIDNGYIEIPDNVLNVIQIRPNVQIGGTNAQENIFSYQYQVMGYEFSPWRPFDQLDYFMRMMNLNQAVDMTSVTPTFEHVRHMRRLYVMTHLDTLCVGYKMALKVSMFVDPDQAYTMYNDRWLKDYSAVLMKVQWGTNVKKYDGVEMLGGVTINGQTIYDEAIEEKKELLEELKIRYSRFVGFIVG